MLSNIYLLLLDSKQEKPQLDGMVEVSCLSRDQSLGNFFDYWQAATGVDWLLTDLPFSGHLTPSLANRRHWAVGGERHSSKLVSTFINDGSAIRLGNQEREISREE
jgi:hypothetical protein